MRSDLIQDVFECCRCHELEYWAEVVISESAQEDFLCRRCGQPETQGPVCARDGVEMNPSPNQHFPAGGAIGRFACPVCSAVTIMPVSRLERKVLKMHRIALPDDTGDEYPRLKDGALDGAAILLGIKDYLDDPARGEEFAPGEEAAYNTCHRLYWQVKNSQEETAAELAGAAAHIQEVLSAD
jgi:hypothetical protein